MLQQTQVDRVVPRFNAFVSRFPTLGALASSDEEDVLETWSGLGYYRRARLLHRLSVEITSGDSRLPESAAELERLPGVGPYTAAAVASLAFGECVPVIDGNVIRVVSRVLCLSGDPRTAVGRRAISDWVCGLMGDVPAGVINEALMELGATLCLQNSPACASCPLREDCGALAEGDPEAFPAPRKRRQAVELRWAAACCIDPDGRWLLQQVADGPILRGLWLPPLAVLEDDNSVVERAIEVARLRPASSPTRLPVVRHSITHRRIRVYPVRLAIPALTEAGLARRWVDPESPRVPTSSLFGKLIKINNLHR